MTSELLAACAGVVLSLVFSYVPKVKDKFAELDGNYKRLVMLAALFVAAVGALGLSCIGRYDAITCDNNGIWQVLQVFVSAAIANQSAYALTPKGKA